MGVATPPVPAARVDTDAGTDAEIISRMGEDPAGFATVFDRYYLAIHAYASRRLGSDPADDVASETFLVAFNLWQRYDTAYSSARPWLFGIAANLIARHHRAEARRYAALARADHAAGAGLDITDRLADQVAGHLDAQAVRARLALALNDIGPADREVLLLVAWAGMSCEETARALEIPAGTARSRLHRARHRLQAALGGADPTTLKED
jgi:RNA polymerase sigma factor (sigma-70 family)